MGQQGKVSTNKAASKVSQLIENLFLIACCITATPPTTWDHQEPIQSLSSELTHKPFMFYYNCTVFFSFICVLSTLFLHIFLPATSSRFSLDCCSVKLNTQHAGRGHFILSCTTVIWVTKPHWCPILVVLFLHMDYYWSLQPQWLQRLCWRAMKTWHLGHGQWWCTGIAFRDLRGSFPIFTILWLQAIGEVLQDAPWDLLQQQPLAHVQTHLPLHGAACVFPLNTPGSVSPPVSSGNQWTSEGLAHKPVKQPEPIPVLLSAQPQGIAALTHCSVALGLMEAPWVGCAPLHNPSIPAPAVPNNPHSNDGMANPAWTVIITPLHNLYSLDKPQLSLLESTQHGRRLFLAWHKVTAQGA